jgi:outer membrane receptor protein involved in Fe transport
MTSPTSPGYQPEQLDAYEVGLKSFLFGHTLRLNAAAFYYKYANIQVRQGLAGSNLVTNAAAGKSSGLDIDYNWQPLDRFGLSGGLGWLPVAKFTTTRMRLPTSLTAAPAFSSMRPVTAFPTRPRPRRARQRSICSRLAAVT